MKTRAFKICRLLALLALPAALAACVRVDASPVWQATLPSSGAAVSLANCSVTESTARYTDADGEETSLPLLVTEGGAPLLALPEDAALTVAFAAPDEAGYLAYTEGEPIEKADYVPGTASDGKATCRFDTVYSFLLTVTTEQGTDALLLDCRR